MINQNDFIYYVFLCDRKLLQRNINCECLFSEIIIIFRKNYHKQNKGAQMDLEIRKFHANEIVPHQVSLKEITTQAKKKEVLSYFDKQSTLIIDYGS